MKLTAHKTGQHNSHGDGPNARLQPRRLMIAPAAVGCKPMFGGPVVGPAPRFKALITLASERIGFQEFVDRLPYTNSTKPVL